MDNPNTGSKGQEVSPTQKQQVTRRPMRMGLTPMEFFTSDPFTLMRRMMQDADGPNRNWAPPMEIFERDGKLVVRADLPGLNAEDVKVEVAGTHLTIEGERKSEHGSNQGGIHHTDRQYGRFYRSAELPEGVQTDQAAARFENGVLEITMPAPQQKSGARQIPVQASATSKPPAAQQQQQQPETKGKHAA